MSSFVRWRFASGVAACVCVGLLATASGAYAATVRGRVVDSLNDPVAGAEVRAVLNGGAAMVVRADADGRYVLHVPGSGSVMLTADAPAFRKYEAPSFYVGDADAVERVIHLAVGAEDEVSVTATGLLTPVAQVSAAVHVIGAGTMDLRALVSPELRLQPGVNVVQTGHYGAATTMFVRGANSDSNKVLIDGVPANDVGGVYDLGLLSPTGIESVEVHRGPDSVLYGSDALGSVVAVQSKRGRTSTPRLDYRGDAGNFHTWNNEVELSAARWREDAYLAFSRLDSSNALPNDRLHLATSVANVGHAFSKSTSIRGSVRHGVSATGVPNAHDIFGISANEKQQDQQTAIAGVVENTLRENWHNVIRYYANRKRQQDTQFGPVGLRTEAFGYTTYYGNVMTIRGANGYSATGRAAIAYGQSCGPTCDSGFPAFRYTATNRDGVQWQSDYRFGQHLSALAGFRYEDERGSNINTAYFTNQKAERRNYDYTVQMQGDVRGRLFYTVGGAVQKNYLFGTEGTPRVGLVWYPLGSATGSSTKLHGNFSKGVQEPNLVAQLGQLYTLLKQLNAPTTGVRPLSAQRVRTYEAGIDQSLLGGRVVLRSNYFHNQFGRYVEYVYRQDIQANFGVSVPNSIFGAYLSSLDFKAQGLEAEAELQWSKHLLLRGGYTYTDAVVQRSYSGDVTAAAGGFPTTNPNLPGIAIGGSSPLVGARPFRRPPHTGYAVAAYTQRKWSAAVKAAFVSRADDSTFQVYSDFNSDNTLLLPNKDLDFAYQRVDADVQWRVTPRVTAYTEMNNLLGQQHMGPIGFPSLPFNFRSGLKVRLGGDR